LAAGWIQDWFERHENPEGRWLDPFFNLLSHFQAALAKGLLHAIPPGPFVYWLLGIVAGARYGQALAEDHHAQLES
jgi:hypothetical protein